MCSQLNNCMFFLNPSLPEFFYPKIPKMCNSIPVYWKCNPIIVNPVVKIWLLPPPRTNLPGALVQIPNCYHSCWILHWIYHYSMIITIKGTGACCCGRPWRKASKAFCELYLWRTEHQLILLWIIELILCFY